MAKLLRIETVSDQIGLKRTAIYDRIKDGTFPKPVKLGPRASVWPADEVQAYSEAVIQGKSTQEISELVSQLHARRSA